jgi:hypothetical protein
MRTIHAVAGFVRRLLTGLFSNNEPTTLGGGDGSGRLMSVDDVFTHADPGFYREMFGGRGRRH